MSTETQLTKAFIKQIPGDLFKLDDKPLLGFPPAFDWNELGTSLCKTLQLKSVSIEPSTWIWRPKDELLSGLGEDLICLPLTVAPFEGSATWAMPKSQMQKLMAILLGNGNGAFAKDTDPDFFKGFARYIAVEAINAIQQTFKEKEIAISIAGDDKLPQDHSLTLDLSIKINDEPFSCRLFLTPEFRSSWKKRYLQKDSPYGPTTMIDALNITVHLEAGRVNLKLSEWKKIKTGDFIFLDQCLLDPDEEKGRVMLVIDGTPCFRAKLKQGSLKILEHPLYHEENNSMDEKNNSDDTLDELSLDSQTGESTAGDVSDLDMSELDLDKELAASIPEESQEKTAPVSGGVSFEKKEAVPVAIGDLNLPVVIEVGRIQMAVKQLLELQPGNMIELGIDPEAGVDLIVNGKRIAKGELLKIGEVLGVRILEIS